MCAIGSSIKSRPRRKVIKPLLPDIPRWKLLVVIAWFWAWSYAEAIRGIPSAARRNYDDCIAELIYG
jgi:hypothetical protein